MKKCKKNRPSPLFLNFWAPKNCSVFRTRPSSLLSCFCRGLYFCSRPAALFWGIFVRAASHFCWRPSFGVYQCNGLTDLESAALGSKDSSLKKKNGFLKNFFFCFNLKYRSSAKVHYTTLHHTTLHYTTLHRFRASSQTSARVEKFRKPWSIQEVLENQEVQETSGNVGNQRNLISQGNKENSTFSGIKISGNSRKSRKPYSDFQWKVF